MMKVTVTKYLNVRTGRPSLNAPCYQYLAPGSELVVDGNFYPGDPYDGIDLWMKDNAGNYYWSGGIETGSIREKILSGDQEYGWLKGFGIPEIWHKGFTGKGIRVAVLDTGIAYPHDHLDLDPALFTDCTGSSSGVADLSGHGTHCAGIIKGYGYGRGPTGIAFGSTLLVGKVTHDQQGDRPGFLVKAIEWATTFKADIISVSKGDPVGHKELAEAVAKATGAGILVVAAAGNRIAGFPSDHIYYPARYPGVFSVGGIDDRNLALGDSLLTGETMIFAPGHNILSTYPDNGFATLSGSSQATPYVAGICALLLEKLRREDPSAGAALLPRLLADRATPAPFGKILNVKDLFS